MTATQDKAQRFNGLDTEAIKDLINTIAEDPAQGQTRWHVTTRWQGGTKTRTHVDHYEIAGQRVDKDWTIDTDEPLEIGGTNTAANPQETLMAGLNACMMVGYAAVATLMGVELASVEIETRGDIDLRGFLGLDPSVKPGYESLDYTVRIKGDGTPEQMRQIHETVQKTSPNYYNITHAVALNADLAIE